MVNSYFKIKKNIKKEFNIPHKPVNNKKYSNSPSNKYKKIDINFDGGMKVSGVMNLKNKRIFGRLYDEYESEEYQGQLQPETYKKVGLGIITKDYQNGNGEKYIYIGNFENDKLNQNGFFCINSSSDNIFYIGNFIDDTRSGFAVSFKPEGNDIIWYIGNFEDNQKNGFGIVKNKNTFHAGLWKDDRLVERIDKDKFLLSYREHFLNEITKIKLEFKDKYDMIEKLPEKIRLLLNDGKNNLQKIMYDFLVI